MLSQVLEEGGETSELQLAAGDEAVEDDDSLEITNNESAPDLGDVYAVEKTASRESVVEDDTTEMRMSDPRMMQRILAMPEMNRIFEEEALQIDETPPLLSTFPDIDELYKEAVHKITNRFTHNVVHYELRKLFEALLVARTNEWELKRKLTKRDQEVQELVTKHRRDPRIARMLKLAEQWRSERNASEQVGLEYLGEMDSMKAEMKSMETNFNNLKKGCQKIQEDLKRKRALENTLEKLEEMNLLKDERIHNMLEELKETQRRMSEQVYEAAKMKDDLTTKIGLRSIHSQNIIDIYKREMEELREMKSNLKVELYHKSQMIQSLSCMVNTIKFNMLGIKKCLSGFQAKCKSLEDKMRALTSANCKLKVDNDALQLLINRLSCLSNRNANRVKFLMSDVVKAKEEVASLKSQLEASDKKLFKQGAALKYYYSETERLRAEISAITTSEAQMVKKLEDDSREIQMMKNKIRVGEIKINSTQSKLIREKSLLTQATAHAESLFKNLSACVKELKSLYKTLEQTDDAVAERTNIIRHLDNLCRAYAKTIYVQDCENESLVINAKNLEQLLRRSKDDMVALRQRNAEAATDARLQTELLHTITYMLSFTQKENETISRMYDRTDDNIILMKQEDAKRIHNIMKLSEDVYANKMLVRGYVKVLEQEKKESGYLLAQLQQAEYEHRLLKFQYGVLRKERDIFGATVIKCNTEIDLLHKRMDVMNSIMKEGYGEVFSQKQDMRILKIEIRNLRRKLRDYKNVHFINNELRTELIESCRDLQLERDKLSALEQMKETVPHPHRYLMHSNMSEYEKVLKIQTLQRAFVHKLTEIGNLEKAILAKDHQMMQMKLLLAKRPGIQAAIKLEKAKHQITRNHSQIKALAAELNMAKFDVISGNERNAKLLAELKTLKEELAVHKRRAVHKWEAAPVVKKTSTDKPAFEIHRAKLRPGQGVLLRAKKKPISASLPPLST